jgi:hypothetical protein
MARRGSNTSGTVAGMFTDRLSAEAAVQQLREVGFPEGQIGLAARDQEQVAGLLAGIGALSIPGIGPILAGGALASTLADEAAGTAAGGLLEILVDMGVPEKNARHFEQGFELGGILLTVQSDGRLPLAREILVDSGADIGPAYWSRRNDAGRSLDIFDRRRGEGEPYAGPERRLASGR